MEPEFWLERWRTGQTGWHQSQPHPFLTGGVFAGALTRPAMEASGPRVLVPLCGASVDMAWLRGRGFEVVGVDLSAEALRRFCAAAGLAPAIDSLESLESLDSRDDAAAGANNGAHDGTRFERFRAPGYELLAGDFLKLDAARLGPVDAVYDRAALVALPAALRSHYATHVAGLCRPGTRVALVAFEYDPAHASGPPFPVPADEVAALYGAAFELAEVARVDVLDANPKLRERGLTWLEETGYELVRRD